jgi:hypothetical protein
MENRTFTRFQCWQDDRIIQVINKEAVSVDRSNFLATHTPLNRIRYERAPQEIIDKTELGLFNELKSGAEQNRHTFMVIQGIPGTGKSHLIRWLKERYDAENREWNGNDVILLIERAYCNLRGTLLQIIDSGVFDQTTLQNHLQRLQDAATKLSSDTLADTIIDQIRNATGEFELPDEQRPRIFIRKRVYNFLQDVNVRKELKKSGGPIDRIRKYLSDGDTNRLGNHEIPGFEPKDFEFDLNTLREIRDGGYKEARELAERLHDDEPEWRQELATYFNRFLNYAVGRTTALSADDLKQIFNELRRQLRKQNRNLALFIEDITAFTGIDEGLIDVLATQHTGEGNREFCRLQSVIGVTDNYFNQHFPDNIKDRVSHRLTLNAEKIPGTYESELLGSSKATADIAARYLNAIRLSQDNLDEWFEHGAHPENLPNKCNQCPLKTTCHEAFGYVDLHPGSGASQHVGLYPFNEEAIWTMYQQLDRSSTALTPRSLLSSVIGYVLESHGPKIQAGEFPPQANQMGSDFKAPSFYNLAHRQILRNQGGSDAIATRLESLILFWGSRSVKATTVNQRRMVGGLSREVFQAFNLPFIEGEVTTVSSTSNRGTSTYALPSTPERIISSTRPSQFLTAQPTSKGQTLFEKEIPIPTEIPTASPQIGRYTEDINNWLNGAKLQNFEKLRELLVGFIEASIDWEIHGINTAQVKDRIRASRMAFEDQMGRIANINDCLIFKRSMTLATVLQALDYLNVNSKTPAPEKIGSYLTFLSTWLAENEARIVAFVQRPTAQSSEIQPLISITLINCILLSCLQGKFEHKSYTSQELLFIVLNDCVRSTENQWKSAIEQAEKFRRSKKWSDLMMRVDRKDNYISVCRKNLLQLLNRPQGGRTTVRFIDIDLALDILEKFEESNWSLTPMDPVSSGASKEWIAAYEINQAFTTNFNEILQEERILIDEQLYTLREIVGDSDPKEIFTQISNWVETMKQLQKPYQLEPKPSATATKLTRVINSLEQVVKEQRPKTLALRLSGILPTMKEADEYQQFLQSFKNEVNKQLAQLQQRFAQLQDETARSTPPALVERTYQEIETILTSTIHEGKEILS